MSSGTFTLSLARHFALQMPHNSIQYIICEAPFHTHAHARSHWQKSPSYSTHFYTLILCDFCQHEKPHTLTLTHIFSTCNDVVDHFRGSLKPKHSINFLFIPFHSFSGKMGAMRIHLSACGYAVSRVVLSLISIENTPSITYSPIHTHKHEHNEKQRKKR